MFRYYSCRYIDLYQHSTDNKDNTTKLKLIVLEVIAVGIVYLIQMHLKQI